MNILNFVNGSFWDELDIDFAIVVFNERETPYTRRFLMDSRTNRKDQGQEQYEEMKNISSPSHFWVITDSEIRKPIEYLIILE
jgi:hypothetical protein